MGHGSKKNKLTIIAVVIRNTLDGLSGEYVFAVLVVQMAGTNKLCG